jgi:hypothetical protein
MLKRLGPGPVSNSTFIERCRFADNPVTDLRKLFQAAFLLTAMLVSKFHTFPAYAEFRAGVRYRVG